MSVVLGVASDAGHILAGAEALGEILTMHVRP